MFSTQSPKWWDEGESFSFLTGGDVSVVSPMVSADTVVRAEFLLLSVDESYDFPSGLLLLL